MGSHCPLLNITLGRSWWPAGRGPDYHQEYEGSLGVTTKKEDTELGKGRMNKVLKMCLTVEETRSLVWFHPEEDQQVTQT